MGKEAANIFYLIFWCLMKLSELQPNPRFSEFRSKLLKHAEWLRPWKGTLFRFQTIDFPAPKDVLGGLGARTHGGRWNPPGLAMLYGSTTDHTALEECKAHDRYYGVDTKGPRLLVAIEVSLVGILDLTDPSIRRELGVTLKNLAAEDWRKLMRGGKESLSQALGRACAKCGASGLLVRSAAVPRGINVVVIPGAHAEDRMVVVDGGKLARFGQMPQT